MDVNVSGFYLWTGMMSFYAWMIYGMVYVVRDGMVNGYNSCIWNLNIVSYSCGGGDYPYVMIWNGLYMNHDDLSCGVCENVAETWNGFACCCPHGSVWSLIWHVGFCAVWIGDALLGFLKEVSCVGNPLQFDYTHHIQNT